MLETFDIVVPFNSLYMKQTYPKNPLVSKYFDRMDTVNSTYHRSALQSIVQQALLQRSVPPSSSEEFRDSEGRPALSMKDLLASILYAEKPNIVLPYL